VKRKEKKRIKETPTSDRKPKKGKEQDHLKKTSLGLLRQGQRLDTSETKLCSSKECKPPNQSSKTQRAPPAHMQASPEPLQLPLDECMQNHLMKTEQLQQLCSDRSDRSPSPVRPVGKIAQHLEPAPVRPVPSIGQTDATWETARAQK
jgi:hypothetical protein